MNARELMMSLDKVVYITDEGQRRFHTSYLDGIFFLTGFEKQRIMRNKKRVDVWSGIVSRTLDGKACTCVEAKYINLYTGER